ncbi:MAG: hypothetical protein RL722_541 [Pseudomonadota bacterium]|jgi:2-C-methyl-D-erythritol 4-phosphate cytidylyltransferase
MSPFSSPDHHRDLLAVPATSVSAISLEAPRCFVLVPCAGVGARSGLALPKQYHRLAGLSVIGHTLQALAGVDALSATLVVLSPEDEGYEAALAGLPAQAHPAWVARCGGATRADTVMAGLAELLAQGAQPHDWVLVHDAARCLVEPAWIAALITACAEDEVGGLLALPLADTLKQSGEAAGEGERVSATVDRRGKWAAQTPQMFRIGLLQRALTHAMSDPALAGGITDEASAVELLGHAPRLVRGHLMNLKLTWPEDFALAERWLQTRPTCSA